MMELIGAEELNLEQAAVIARAMWRVAEAEAGIHAQERELIEGFYNAILAEHPHVRMADFRSRAFELEEAQRVLDTPALRELLLHSCFLLSYADGHCAPVERAEIDGMARGLDISAKRYDAIDRAVKRQLLSQFEGVSVFKSATYDIGRQLGLSERDVDDLLARG
ncbi:MAG: hypothetical protein ACKO6N_14230 [Myxococcota bacterium]